MSVCDSRVAPASVISFMIASNALRLPVVRSMFAGRKEFSGKMPLQALHVCVMILHWVKSVSRPFNNLTKNTNFALSFFVICDCSRNQQCESGPFNTALVQRKDVHFRGSEKMT